jgi:hypothetical protein
VVVPSWVNQSLQHDLIVLPKLFLVPQVDGVDVGGDVVVLFYVNVPHVMMIHYALHDDEDVMVCCAALYPDHDDAQVAYYF